MLSGPIAAAVAGIPTYALECRRRRSHAWEPYTAELGRGIWTETERCGRCETERYCELSNTDGRQLAAWRYRYPDGYRVAGGLSEDARAALRLESLRRRRRQTR